MKVTYKKNVCIGTNNVGLKKTKQQQQKKQQQVGLSFQGHKDAIPAYFTGHL